ncbi:unnamed protein product [Lactuca saligna]|uniref:Carbohydrate kinase PfkB domain-containing protein n=1 Tax=Lactuca saligna TaxID=75948 RepID=A0AA35VSW8_LACSI|nr:unnamed protein product [Lactuca saligna]
MALVQSSALCFSVIPSNFRPSSCSNRLSSSDSRSCSSVKAYSLTSTPSTPFSSSSYEHSGTVDFTLLSRLPFHITESVMESVASAQGSAETDESSIVVCFGEMLIDFVPTINGLALAEAPTFKKAPGGAPANVVVDISHLGGSSAFIGKVIHHIYFNLPQVINESVYLD